MAGTSRYEIHYMVSEKAPNFFSISHVDARNIREAIDLFYEKHENWDIIRIMKHA